MRRVLTYFFQPFGSDIRFFAALILLAQAVGYVHVMAFGLPLTSSYTVQARLAPISVYAAVLGILGIGLILTMDRRRMWYARLVAGIAFSVQAMIAYTYIQSGGVGGFYWGVVVAWALAVESIWIKSRDT